MKIPYRIVVIGASLGGLKALRVLFAGIHANFSLPFVIVLHRNKDSDNFLQDLLQKRSELNVIEVEDKMPITAGNIYLAPPDYHLLIDNDHFTLSTGPPVSMARPSIDVLFESCADVYGEAAIGVILTGGGNDGAYGLAKIKECGGCLIVEDPSTAESAAMPEAAIAASGTAQVYPLAEIAPLLTALAERAQQPQILSTEKSEV